VHGLPAGPTGVSVPQPALLHGCHVKALEGVEGAAQNICCPVDESVAIFIQSGQGSPTVSADATGADTSRAAQATLQTFPGWRALDVKEDPHHRINHGSHLAHWMVGVRPVCPRP
jgi:hypothetical protein